MRAALSLAARGLGNVAPNPAVGCIIAHQGIVVGRGWTRPGGRPHAETVALDQAGDRSKGATAYVTLEPCSHHGQTPPCADALIKAGISRVVVAIRDPDERVAGQGLERLKAAGIDVSEDVCAREAAQLNAGYLKVRNQNMPLVTLKIAMSLDGRIATSTGRSQWITGPQARQSGHMLRANHDAIAVGIGTAQTDNPELTCRVPGLEGQSPVRVVFDSGLKLDRSSNLADTATIRTIILTTTETAADRTEALRRQGVEVISVGPDAESHVDIESALYRLSEAGITRLLVEGGAKLATAFLKSGHVDQLAIYTAPTLLGSDGLAAIARLGLDDPGSSTRFTLSKSLPLGPDRLDLYYR